MNKRVLSLAFERRAHEMHGRRVRFAAFEQRSNLPVSAACLAANSVRETLGTLLQQPVRMRLIEPIVPDPKAWEALADGALLFCIRGSVCDAAIVLRRGDALAFAAAAFGEIEPGDRAISPIELEILERTVNALGGCFAAVCGKQSGIERILDIRGFATYFELLLEAPACARIGVALSCDPAPAAVPGLQVEDLGAVEVEVSAVFAQGLLAAKDFLDLRPGALVPMMTRIGEPGLLASGSTALARGECGAVGERNVLVVVAPA